MGKKYTAQDYRRVLGKNLVESEVIDRKVEDAYEMIRNQANASAHRKRNGKLKGWIMGMSTVAAALVLSVTVCVANPALAAKLPFVGHIFETVGSEVGYKGDYSAGASKLVTPEQVQEDGTIDSPYVQKSGDITFTVSECNYESMAMYLAVSLESEKGFSEEMRNYARYGFYAEPGEEPEDSEGYSVMYMESTAVMDMGHEKIICDPAHGMAAPYLIEGKYVDEHTFAGIIRVDLVDLQVLDENEEWKTVNLPDAFKYQLSVTKLYADWEGEQIEGDWSFDLDVKLNHENTVTKEIHETNEDGIGISTVTKTDYELKAELLLPEAVSPADYIVEVCDGDGKPLESQGNIAEIFSTYGRDVSHIIIYVVEYNTYMDECKGNNYPNLPDKAVFQTEVTF